jgi:hypothetical protein
MTGKVLTLCAVWLILAVIAGASGMVSTLVPPIPQILLGWLEDRRDEIESVLPSLD